MTSRRALCGSRILCCSLLFPLLFSSCASSGGKSPGALSRIVESGVIRVGMTGEQPPLTMMSVEGEFFGLDVALMRVLARSSLSNAKLVLTAGLDEGVRKVLAGEVDALVADRETCSFAVLRYPDEGLIASATPFTLEPMGIAVPLDQPKLANLLRTHFSALSETGALDKAKAVWFEDPSWVKSLR